MTTALEIAKQCAKNSLHEYTQGEDFVPHDWVINSMNSYLNNSLNEIFLECEQGDEEHRQWLKDKFDSYFYKKVANSQ